MHSDCTKATFWCAPGSSSLEVGWDPKRFKKRGGMGRIVPLNIFHPFWRDKKKSRKTRFWHFLFYPSTRDEKWSTARPHPCRPKAGGISYCMLPRNTRIRGTWITTVIVWTMNNGQFTFNLHQHMDPAWRTPSDPALVFPVVLLFAQSLTVIGSQWPGRSFDG